MFCPVLGIIRSQLSYRIRHFARQVLEYTIAALMDELIKFPVCSDDKASQLRLIYNRISISI